MSAAPPPFPGGEGGAVDPRIRRRFVLEAKIGADDLDALGYALDEIARRLHEGLPICCTSGGPDAGYHVEVTEDPSVTHASYFEAINKELARIRSIAAPGETP